MKSSTTFQVHEESSRQTGWRIPVRMHAGRVHSELTLGTAQLGMAYGIANRVGQPWRSAAVSLVHQAIAYGVMHLDTARGYGESEAVLGEALQGNWRSQTEIITKLDPLAVFSSDTDATTVRAAVDASVATSCRELRTNPLPVLLLHRWQHKTQWQGAAWRRLLELQAERTIGILGVSVYDPEEAFEALQDPEIQHLQLPMNLLDWRWKAAGIEHAISLRPDVVVHARSAFLQGVLLQPPEMWPNGDYYDARACVNRLHDITQKFGREGVADLCLAYLRAQPWITSIVTGCETTAQLEHTVSLFRSQTLTSEQCEELEHALPQAPATLLNPSQWKIA
jgi:aryl-alcohol dehydrogenase-like predicted oxidoreductase